MTAVVSYNCPLGFFSGKWSAVGAKTDLICTCLSFGRCVVPKTNRYFYTFALWNTKRSMLKLLTSRLPLRWISLTSSSFKHHASFIIQIHQLAFLEHTHSVARKYFEFDYSLSICLPLVEWVKYKTSWMYSWLWCNRERLNWAECKTKLRKANDHDNIRFRKIKRGRQ